MMAARLLLQSPSVQHLLRRMAEILALPMMVACAEAEPPVALAELTVPAVVRVGTPVYVVGRSLAGRSLRLKGAPVTIPLIASGQRSDGAELAYGHVPAHPAWLAGQGLAQGCLTGDDLGQWQFCAAATAVFQTAWLPQVQQVIAPAGWRWGQTAVLQGDDLLLPGEGWQHTEVEIDGEVRSAALTTSVADGRRRGLMAVSPNWLGAHPGHKRFRARVAGHTAQGTITGPWSPWQEVQVAVPVLQAAGPGWRRGDYVPAAAFDVPEPKNWTLLWSGHWQTEPPAGPSQPGAPSQFSTPGGPGGRSTVSSSWWSEHLPLRALTSGFQGHVRLQIRRGTEVWEGPEVSVAAPVLATVQRIEVVTGAGWSAALARFGLAQHRAAVEVSVLTRLRGHFASAAVQLLFTPWPVDDGRETLRVWLGDQDANGLHLIGAETSLGGTGKDVGNLWLAEQIGGFDQLAFAAGIAPIGGVFVGEMMGFSRKLHPKSASASPEFDATFDRFCPELGGTPAAAGPHQLVDKAIAHLAAAVAEACAHEIGHALGMPAGTLEIHRSGDEPGWIMDSGSARPWAERAGLVGAPPSQWGPADAAYLVTILPRFKSSRLP